MIARRRSRGALLDAVDSLTMLGLQTGGLVFVLATAYLLWGIISGSVSDASSLPEADQLRILANLKLVTKVMTIAGLVAIVSAAARYYSDEITGYALLIGGAVFYWGIPMLVGSSFQASTLGAAVASPLHLIISQFQVVGMVAVGGAVPFILADFWFKLRGIRRSTSRGAVVVTKEEDVPKSRLYLFCWQMPYCREYLKKFCKAYEQRKSCWRLKSGCYCDEDMILRVMKNTSTAKLAGFDQRYSGSTSSRSRQLSNAQKRQRCRECFLYQEHQKQKYRILSPLVFPAAVAIMWTYLKPVKSFLSRALEFTDQLAGRMSFTPGAEQPGSQFANAHATSETVLWIFLLCIGLILTTYLLRALEYAVFDLQV